MKRTWQLGNIVSLVFALAANFVVGAQVLDLPSIGQISDKYATYLTPAGYAFSIWSLIYVLLIVFVIYQARDILKPNPDNRFPQQTGPFFIIASICNGVWTYIFVNEMVGLSVAVLLLLTGLLYVLLWRLKVAVENPPIPYIVCVWWPLMIYTGWVTVASVVNASSWLDSLGFSVTPLLASVVLVVLAAALLALLVKRNVRELLLASTWGVAAIGAQQLQESGDQIVAATAFIVAGILLVAVCIHAYINRQSNPFYRLITHRSTTD